MIIRTHVRKDREIWLIERLRQRAGRIEVLVREEKGRYVRLVIRLKEEEHAKGQK